MESPSSDLPGTAPELLELGDRTFRARQYAEAGEIYQRAVGLAEKTGENELLTEALAQAARSYLICNEKEQGRPWLARAAAVARSQEPRGWSRYLGVRGRFEWKDDDLETATATFKDMYDYCMEHGLHDRAVDAAHMVALTAPSEEQIEWAKKGIAAAEAGGNDGWLGPLWNNLGWTYSDLGQHEEALEALQNARTYHYKASDDHARLIADWAVGVAHHKLGQLKEARAWLEPAREWAERRYAEEASPARAEWVGFGHKALAEVDADEGDWSAALAGLREARNYLEAAGMPEWDAKGFADLDAQIAEAESRSRGE